MSWMRNRTVVLMMERDSSKHDYIVNKDNDISKYIQLNANEKWAVFNLDTRNHFLGHFRHLSPNSQLAGSAKMITSVTSRYGELRSHNSTHVV